MSNTTAAEHQAVMNTQGPNPTQNADHNAPHAAAAAGQPGTAHVTGTPDEVLSFKLGSEEYGLDILKVQEIRGYEPPTRIVGAPGFMKGVTNLRGVIVPIVDLRMRFALEDVKYDSFTVVIVLNVLGRTVGIVVDSVSDVLQLKAEQVQTAPEFNGRIDAQHIIGLGTVKSGDTERMLILMDIEQLLASADMALFDSDAQLG